MIRAVVFDFDGTLVDFINSDVSALKYIHRLTGTITEENEFVDTAIRETNTTSRNGRVHLRNRPSVVQTGLI